MEIESCFLSDYRYASLNLAPMSEFLAWAAMTANPKPTLLDIKRLGDLRRGPTILNADWYAHLLGSGIISSMYYQRVKLIEKSAAL